jgi:protoporphyrinogen oxidase
MDTLKANSENTHKHPIVVVGAGPAGLTAAAECVRLRGGSGEGVTLLEQDPSTVGGISRTVCHKGFRFDIGGHRFFSKNPEIVRWWQERLPEDFLSVRRQSRIFYQGRFYDYPLKPWNALRNLGFLESLLCGLSYVHRRMWPIRPETSFADWVSNRFGNRLFRHFFKTYTEKVWGIPCTEISADWAAQRIQGLSLMRAVWNAFSKPQPGGPVVKTLIDRFQYPRLGPGMMWEQTRDDLLKAGVNIQMGRKVTEILWQNTVPDSDKRRVVSVRTLTPDGKTEDWAGKEFILSMPLRETLQALRPLPPEATQRAARSLLYRDFMTVALLIRQPEKNAVLFPDNWIYIHDNQVQMGRIQNFNNWSLEMVPQPKEGTLTCLGLEYFCNQGDTLWEKPDEELLTLAKRELMQVGIFPSGAVRMPGLRVEDGCVVRMPKAYPVYGMKYRDTLRVIRKELENFSNLQVCGRNGMHKYNNQDHSMMTGLLAARNIADQARPPEKKLFDLWSVNEDSLYQEEV